MSINTQIRTEITNRIIAALEDGNLPPWRKPWINDLNAGFPQNVTEDLGDYDQDTCNYGPSGQVLDLDHLMVYGTEGSKRPFKCRFHGEHLPSEGVEPTELMEWPDM